MNAISMRNILIFILGEFTRTFFNCLTYITVQIFIIMRVIHIDHVMYIVVCVIYRVTNSIANYKLLFI